MNRVRLLRAILTAPFTEPATLRNLRVFGLKCAVAPGLLVAYYQQTDQQGYRRGYALGYEAGIRAVLRGIAQKERNDG